MLTGRQISGCSSNKPGFCMEAPEHAHGMYAPEIPTTASALARVGICGKLAIQCHFGHDRVSLQSH